MEDKQHLEIEDGTRRVKTSHLGITLIVLSLAVAASVGCLIYVSTFRYQVQPNPQSEYATAAPVMHRSRAESHTVAPYHQEKVSKTDEAVVNFRDEDGSELSEDIRYDETRDVGIFYGSDGSFLAEDFEKGINVIKAASSGECYVIPVGTNKTAGRDLKNFIKKYGGSEVEVGAEHSYSVNILPGTIEDTSFLPQEANEQCSSFQWLSIVGEGTGETSEGGRVKRAVCRACVYYTYRGSLYRYCLYYVTTSSSCT